MEIKLTGTVYSTTGLRTMTRQDGTQGLVLSVTIIASRGNHSKRRDLITGKEYKDDIFTCDFFDQNAQAIASQVIKGQNMTVYGELLQTEYQSSLKRVVITAKNPMYNTMRQFVGSPGCPLILANDGSILMDADIAQKGTIIRGTYAEFPAMTAQGTQSFTPASNVPQATNSFTPQAPQAGFVVQTPAPQTGFVPQAQPGFVPQAQAPQPGFVPQAPVPQTGFVAQTPVPQAGFVPQAQAPAPQPSFVPQAGFMPQANAGVQCASQPTAEPPFGDGAQAVATAPVMSPAQDGQVVVIQQPTAPTQETQSFVGVEAPAVDTNIPTAGTANQEMQLVATTGF